MYVTCLRCPFPIALHYFDRVIYVRGQAIYGCVLAFGKLIDKATASLVLATAMRTVALQVYEIGERWQTAMLQATVTARVAIASFAELGNSTGVQEAHDIEESLVQIYTNRLAARGPIASLRKLEPEDVVVSTLDNIMNYI